MQINTRLQRS